MREFHKILDVPQEKPSDWIGDPRIVNEEEGPAKILTSFTPEEKHLIFKRRILMLLPKKGPPRRSRLVPEEEKKVVFWLIRDKEKILGPFTASEMEEKIRGGELTGLEIKRDDDKEFVDFDSLCKAVENPLDGINKVNNGSGNILFVNEEEEDLVRLSLTEKKKNVFQMGNNFLKSKEFLKKKECQIEVESIVQKIYGKTKANAINIICLLTTMNKEDCETLLDLITGESGREMISDNNPDGFVKVLKKHTRR